MDEVAGSAPLVVGHRGFPARFPEHTAAGFEAALEAGADVIEVDVVACSDATLVARHDTALAGTTDVADRVDLADRRSARRVAHEDVVDWWVDELTAAEVTSLRCRERWPHLRPGSAEFDGADAVLTLADVLELARAAAADRQRPVGVAIELKDVEASALRGVDVVASLLRDLAVVAEPSVATPVWVMAFEAGPLVRLKALRDAGAAPAIPLVQLVQDAAPHGERAWDTIAERADLVSLELDLVLASAGATNGAEVLRAAADRRLPVWTWTLRAENAFLPERLSRGEHPGDHGDVAVQVREAVSRGVTGLVGDQPDVIRRALS